MIKNIAFTDCYGVTHESAILLINTVHINKGNQTSLSYNVPDKVHKIEYNEAQSFLTYEVAFFANQQCMDDGFIPAPYQRFDPSAEGQAEAAATETSFSCQIDEDTDTSDIELVVKAAEDDFITNVLNAQS